ncbi:MAG: efflux RND transporter permease subunit [Planctomycetota bacterium]
MNIASFSIRHPVLTIMATLIVIVLGAISLSRLPVDLMPDISFPTLSVSTTYTNAGPREIEELITRPIEQAVGAVPGVQEITSESSEGSSSVRVTFAWGTDLDAAANDIRDRLDRVISSLPDEADRPTLRKFDLAAFPVLILGAYSDLDPLQMRQLIEDQITYRIERVPGVASLTLWGGLKREIHVDLAQDKLKAVGVTIDQILARIQAANVAFAAGIVEEGDKEVAIRTLGEFASVDELRETVVAVQNGVPVRLAEIADVTDTAQKVRSIVRVNGKPGFRLAIMKQSGTNTVQVAKAALAELARINRDIPQVRIVPIINTADYIQQSINNIGQSAMYGGVLAIIVLLIFLQNMRSTLIIATAIPVAIIATFTLMYFNGFTLNIMTLGGMALGVGMLVDNSIVVLENIFRLRQEESMGRLEAAESGTNEVMAAVISSTLTTVVVFLPLVFMAGMAGVMFKQLAVVISFALLCSLVAALTIVPMLAARLPQSSLGGGHRSAPVRLLVRVLGAMETTYKELLHWALDHKAVVTVIVVAVLGTSLFLLRLIGAELMPATDEGQVRIDAEGAVGTRLDLTDERMRAIEAIVAGAVPEADRSVASIGGGGFGRAEPVNAGSMNIMLVPMAQRTRSSEQVAQDLRERLTGVPGMTIRTRAGQSMTTRMMSRAMSASGERINIEVRGYDLERADQIARQVQAAIKDIEGVTDVRLEREAGAPERTINIDRQKAADMRVTVSQIANLLQTALGGTTAGYYREAGKQYRILVRVKDSEKLAVRDILDLPLTNAAGRQVALRNFTAVEPHTGPTVIERKDQERVANLAINITGRDLTSIIADIRARIRNIPLGLDFTLNITGDYEEQQKSFRELLLSFVLALMLVYMVMAAQYESLRDPLVVMFSVPLAVIGVILALTITNTTFNIQSFIGCIMLAGIVVNNAILLVDHTNLLRRRDHMPLRAAIEEAGRRRLRPILMTTATTVLGLMPLALGLGEGGEAQAPLARVVIGGLLSSTLITLVFIPIVYSWFERMGKEEKHHA